MTKMNEDSKQFPHHYSLSLGEGMIWKFCFSSGLKEWGEEFSSILGLHKNQNNWDHRIFYCMDDETRPLRYSFLKSQNSNTGNQLRCFSFKWMDLQYHPISNEYYGIFHHPANRDKDEVNFIHRMTALFPFYIEMIRSGSLVLHGALFHLSPIGGLAILAPSGTGKSTCARRVPPYWSAWSDDLLLVVKDASNIYRAHPLPTWSNFLWGQDLQNRWDIHQQTLMKGFFFLQKSDEDEVLPLSSTDSAQWLYNSSFEVMEKWIKVFTNTRQREIKRQIFENACDLSRNTTSAILKATKHGSFWKGIERFMG